MIDEPVVKVDGVFETIGTLSTQKKALEAELAAVLKGRDRVIADLEAANRHIELLESLLVDGGQLGGPDSQAERDFALDVPTAGDRL